MKYKSSSFYFASLELALSHVDRCLKCIHCTYRNFSLDKYRKNVETKNLLWFREKPQKASQSLTRFLCHIKAKFDNNF